MKPWGGMDPNSRHQIWSRWTFTVNGRRLPLAEVQLNAARWLRGLFGSVGRARVYETVQNGLATVVIEAEVEGAPVTDPAYTKAVRRAFRRFVEQGWGSLALWNVRAEVLAGDAENGKPPAQLVVMPSIQRGS